MRKRPPEGYGKMIDAGNMEHLERFQTDLQQVFGMLQCKGEKQKLQKYIQGNRRGDRMREKGNGRLADHGIGF